MARLGDERKIWRKAAVVGITRLILFLDNSHFWISTLYLIWSPCTDSECNRRASQVVQSKLLHTYTQNHRLRSSQLPVSSGPSVYSFSAAISLASSCTLDQLYGKPSLSQYLCIAHSNQVTIGNSFEPVTSCTDLQRKNHK